ncbi:MAG: homocysteine S-methyltransferase family protein [Clostridia bacterium]|nr:homocysteine S-methyltransferase family protein [Clostridia bacterium]
MNVREFLQQNIVLLDGGTGTLLQAAGLPLGELPERWNLSHAEILKGIHQAYFDAGSNVVATNTFGANALKFSEEELEKLVAAAIENVREGAKRSLGAQEKFIALDIGPLGKLLKPYGDLDFEVAVETFAKTVRLGVKYGADLILIETLGDSYEAKAAVLAAKENSDLPIFVSCAYGEDGKLMTGASPEAMVALLEGMGVDALGINCSLGPKEMQTTVTRLLNAASVPVLVKPNAGLPEADGSYNVDEEEFAKALVEFVKQGARLVGGCCGTTPSYIESLRKAIAGIEPLPIAQKAITSVSSYTHAVYFDTPVLIGERINPTGKKRFRLALEEKDVGYVLAEGIAQQEKGAHILDVNVGAPGIDEKTELPRYVEELQAVINLPLQIDTSDPVAMEHAMRRYNGKPLVNSVNGKKESMAAVFPLVKKYGGVVVGLTLDENGIPETSEGRARIAEKIIAEAQKYGIQKKDIIIDPLAMTVSADKNAANVTLSAVKLIRERFGVHTSLGVSNVSFGLPCRDAVNAAFFALALENGLSAAILNPNSAEMLKTYYAYLALKGLDENCVEYVRFATERLTSQIQTQTAVAATPKSADCDAKSQLQTAIVRGMKTEAAALCKTLLNDRAPLEIVNGEIVPALDEVGVAYEEKRAFLPQLLMSAESAKAAFEEIRAHVLATGEQAEKKCKIVLATVKGDIHDIGKNIVGTLLSNYGFDVLDLGRDVAPEIVVKAVLETDAPLVGLSALMTTTLPSMEETVRSLKAKTPNVKIMVGGAVLTEEYAKQLGADGYSKDGMGAVRFAERIYADLCKKS